MNITDLITRLDVQMEHFLEAFKAKNLQRQAEYVLEEQQKKKPT